MAEQLPKSRYYLQKLTRRIETLEKLKPFSCPSSGTGVKAAAKEMGNKYRLQRLANDLKQERALVKAGLIEIEERGNVALFRLTNDGVVQVLKDRIVLEKNQLLTAEVCFVIFDIPEDVRKTRAGFRRFLKQAGFEQRQQSVWTTKKDVAVWMQQLVDALGIEGWVKVVTGQELQSKNGPTGPNLDQP